VRYAGDEFIVVIADCSPEMAETKLRELQERVANITIPVRSGHVVRLSASAGAAVYPQDGTSYEALLANADHRMYRDKANRRAGLASRRELAPVTPGLEPPHASLPSSGTNRTAPLH
jgi:diguanylate cyclase (GGDEF)-like protein